MLRNVLSNGLLALLFAGCTQEPSRNSVPQSPPERKGDGGVKVDVPGVKVDVKRKDQRDTDNRKIDVKVDVKP